MNDETKEYIDLRKESFDVRTKIETDFLTKIPNIWLSVTLNGSHFMVVQFSESEWEIIKKKVDDEFKTSNSHGA